MVLIWKLILLLSLVSDAIQITSRFCTRSNKDAKNCSHIIEWWVTHDSLQEEYLWLKHSKFILYLYMYKFNYHWWQAQALHLRDTGTIQSVFPSRLSGLAPTKTEFTWFKGEVHAHVRHKYSTWNKHTSLCDDWCSHSFSRKKLRNNIRRFRNRLIPKWRRVSLLLVLKLELYQKCNFIDNLFMPQLT